jgi:hypothetical protein
MLGFGPEPPPPDRGGPTKAMALFIKVSLGSTPDDPPVGDEQENRTTAAATRAAPQNTRFFFIVFSFTYLSLPKGESRIYQRGLNTEKAVCFWCI